MKYILEARQKRSFRYLPLSDGTAKEESQKTVREPVPWIELLTKPGFW